MFVDDLPSVHELLHRPYCLPSSCRTSPRSWEIPRSSSPSRQISSEFNSQENRGFASSIQFSDFSQNISRSAHSLALLAKTCGWSVGGRPSKTCGWKASPPRQLRRHLPMHRSFEDHGPRTQPRPPCTTHDEWSLCVRPPASSSWEQALSLEVLGLHTRVGGGLFTPRLTNPAKIFFFALKIKLKNSGVTYRTESVFFSAEFLHFYFFFCFRFRFLIYFLRRTAFIPNAKLPTTLKWLH